jgi:hypothetical protein
MWIIDPKEMQHCCGWKVTQRGDPVGIQQGKETKNWNVVGVLTVQE